MYTRGGPCPNGPAFLEKAHLISPAEMAWSKVVHICVSLYNKTVKVPVLLMPCALASLLTRGRTYTHTLTHTTQTIHVENAAAKAPTVMLHQMTVHDMYYEPRC